MRGPGPDTQSAVQNEVASSLVPKAEEKAH